MIVVFININYAKITPFFGRVVISGTLNHGLK